MSSNPFPPLLILKQEREVRGWSQKKVAEQLGTKRITVIRWERGQAFPSVYYRGELCKLFGACMEQFFRSVALDSLKARLPVESAVAGMGEHGSLVYAERRFELIGSFEPRTEYQQGPMNQGVLTDQEMPPFPSEKSRLEIQEKRLELQSRCIEETIKIADLTITVLDPACDARVRSLTIRELLTMLQRAYEEGIQEPSLPTLQSVEQTLESVKRARAQTGSSEKRPDLSPLQITDPVSTGLDDTPEKGQESSPHQESIQDDLLRGVRAGKILRNPYGRFTAVLSPEEFAGRSQMVQDIYAALFNGQSVSLVGLSTIGKSSVPHYLCA